MRDNRFDAGLNANLDTGSVMFKISFATSCLEQPGNKVITKLDVAHQTPQYLQPLLAFMPKAL
jgi:hypothetical protein